METTVTAPEETSHRTSSTWFLAIGCVLGFVVYLIGFNDNVPGIALAFFSACSLIMGVFYYYERSDRSKPGQDMLYWIPRVLPVAVVLFGSGFLFDILKGSLRHGQLFTGMLSAALIPIIPIVLILMVWAVSWRWELIGGVLYFALAIFMSWYLGPPGTGVISFDRLASTPFVLIGGIVLLNWFTGNRYSSMKRTMPVWVPVAVVAGGLSITALLVFVFP